MEKLELHRVADKTPIRGAYAFRQWYSARTINSQIFATMANMPYEVRWSWAEIYGIANLYYQELVDILHDAQMTDLHQLVMNENGVDREPILIVGFKDLPGIVSAVNYIHRECSDIVRQHPHARIKIERPFAEQFRRAYQNSKVDCRIMPETLNLVLDPESLTSSGAICRIQKLTPAEIDEQLKELAAGSLKR